MRVIASDESRTRRLTATKLHGTSPRGEQSSTEAVAEVQTDNRKVSRWVRNRNNEGQCDRFVKAEKSEEWMARSPVWPDDVIASEMASRHQPMNWRDSIWVQDSVTRRRSRSGQRSVELPMKENIRGFSPLSPPLAPPLLCVDSFNHIHLHWWLPVYLWASTIEIFFLPFKKKNMWRQIKCFIVKIHLGAVGLVPGLNLFINVNVAFSQKVGGHCWALKLSC